MLLGSIQPIRCTRVGVPTGRDGHILEFVIEASLPGMKPEDAQITAMPDQVTARMQGQPHAGPLVVPGHPRRTARGRRRPMPSQESIEDVLVMHAHRPMRLLLRLALTNVGYAVTEVPTYAALLRSLRTAAGPRVAVGGNWASNFRAEDVFFGRVAVDATLAWRHRFVLLSTVPEAHPQALDAQLRGLGVAVVRVPFQLPELLATVAVAAGRTPVEGASAG